MYCHNVDTWDNAGGKAVPIADIVWEVKKNVAYLTPNRGGITVSGGDPMEQPSAVRDLFSEIKGLPITTCIDTAGYRLDDDVKSLLSVTDLVLLDMKQPDAERHRELTGHRNETVLAFQDYLDAMKIKYWLRFTVVEGVNDDDATLALLRERIAKRPMLERFEVLPYHTLGAYKWKELGIPYRLKDKKPASAATVARVCASMKDIIDADGKPLP